MTDNFFVNLDDTVKFFDLCRISLEIDDYIIAFGLVLHFVSQLTLAPFIFLVDGAADLSDVLLTSSTADLITSSSATFTMNITSYFFILSPPSWTCVPCIPGAGSA